jgi:hypothetical protein
MPYFDQSGVLISDVDLPKAFREREVADRQETVKAINLLHENDAPDNCQDND